jgi:hypothetical protein
MTMPSRRRMIWTFITLELGFGTIERYYPTFKQKLTSSHSIEWFIDTHAFSPSYDLNFYKVGTGVLCNWTILSNLQAIAHFLAQCTMGMPRGVGGRVQVVISTQNGWTGGICGWVSWFPESAYPVSIKGMRSVIGCLYIVCTVYSCIGT